jgi:ABC-2 type transport system ATP-binding protein
VSPDATQVRDLLAAPGVSITSTQAGVLDVDGLTASRIGEVAAEHRLVLHELTPLAPSLEEAFMELTRDSVEYHGGVTTSDRKAA